MIEEAQEIEGIVVMSTRSDCRIADEPVRVEVLDREEIEEKLMMTPGDIAMMLNVTGGLRVQNPPPDRCRRAGSRPCVAGDGPGASARGPRRRFRQVRP